MRLKVQRKEAFGKPISTRYSRTTGEKIDSDCIEIVALQWDKTSESCVVSLALGGYDEAGVFHPDPELQIVRYKLSKSSCPIAWDAGNLSAGPDIDSVKKALEFEPAAIASVAASRWKLPGLEMAKAEKEKLK